MTEPTHEAETETDETQPPKKGLFGRLRTEPLLPEAGAGGAPLTAVIGVMSFLAVLAMAAALIINQSTTAWTSDLRSEITIQVKGATAADIEAGVAAVRRVLADTQGIEEVTERSREESAALLEPWLGRGNVEAFLNIPAILEVKASPACATSWIYCAIASPQQRLKPAWTITPAGMTASQAPPVPARLLLLRFFFLSWAQPAPFPCSPPALALPPIMKSFQCYTLSAPQTPSLLPKYSVVSLFSGFAALLSA